MPLQLRLPDIADHIDINCIAPGNDPTVVRCLGLHTNDKIHPADIRPHGIRHLYHTQIGHAQAALALAYGIKYHLHRKIFDKQGHHLEDGNALTVYIGGNAGTHILTGDLQPHAMMYNAAQLLQGVIPQAGIRLRCNILGKIPQRLAGE